LLRQLGNRRRRIAFDLPLKFLGKNVGDSDGGDLLAFGHAGGLGGFTLRNISDGIVTIFGRVASVIELLQQLARPLDRRCRAA